MPKTGLFTRKHAIALHPATGKSKECGSSFWWGSMLPSNMADYQGVQSKSKGKSARETRCVLQWPTHHQPVQPSGSHYEQSIHSCQWPSHLLKVPSANTMALGTKPQHESCWRQTGLKHHQNAVFLLVYADLENCSWNSIICFHFYRLSCERAFYNNI